MTDVPVGGDGTAKRIRALRRKLGLTQADLAAVLDVSQAAVSRWEQGLHAPPEETLTRIAVLGGMTAAALRYGPAGAPEGVAEEIAYPRSASTKRRTTDHIETTIACARRSGRGDVAIALQVILDKCQADDARYPGDRRHLRRRR